jgi:16S rRNA (guanine1516-N2)-methyltransferase
LTPTFLLPATTSLTTAAQQLAAAFHFTVINQPPTTPAWFLYLTETRLELRDPTIAAGPVYVDFVGGTLGYRRRHGGGRNQPLAKAVGLKSGIYPTILDATAGLGRDALVLASLNCQVDMMERSPAAAALLHDGLQRARYNPQLSTLITERLQLLHYDAQDWLRAESQRYDVIYLDPMYPHRQQSALVKKEMRLLRQLVGDDLDAPNLLQIALTHAHQRVVVKRPQWAPTLGGSRPHFNIHSDNTRFDVYLVR